MNPVQLTHVAPEPENIKLEDKEEFEASQPSTQRVRMAARMRYALLVGIALLVTSLTVVILDSIRETEAEIEAIHATLVSLR